MDHTLFCLATAADSEQPIAAPTNAHSHSDDKSDYADMVYEYIEENHITDLGILSPKQLAAAHQRAIDAPASLPSATSQTMNTAYNTIEEANDLPVSHHNIHNVLCAVLTI